MIQLIRKDQLTTRIWSGGTTTQLYIFPEDGDYQKRTFDYRISTATVELETSDFTKLLGINRLIMSLDEPLSLKHNNSSWYHLKPFEVAAFKGEDETVSQGQVTDFNVMFGDKYDAQMYMDTEVNLKATDVVALYAYEDMSEIVVDNQVFSMAKGDVLIAENTSSIVKCDDTKIVVVLIKKK